MTTNYVTDLAGLLRGICDVPAGLNTQIFDVQLDSRKVEKGCLFLALAGSTTSSQNYIEEALNKGASAVLIEGTGRGPNTQEHQGVVELFVEDLRDWVGVIADRFFQQPSKTVGVIGVTGTNGKTSVSNYIANLFELNEMPTGVIGTLGYGLAGQELTVTNYTTPDAVEVHRCLAKLKEQGAKYVVMEVSSHGLEQGRVDGVRFEGAVFTNLSRDHLDYHGSMEAYAAAKQKLFEREELDFAILNADDLTSKAYASVLHKNVNLLRFGVDTDSDISVKQAMYSEGINASVHLPTGTLDLSSKLMGPFNLSNLLAVIATGLAKGLSQKQLEKVSELKAVPGRMEMIKQVGQPVVVVDYAHTPDALSNALEALKHHCQGLLTVVFGCGGDRDTGKRPEMAAVAEACANKIYVTDDNPRTESPEKIVTDILSGFSDKLSVRVIHERAIAIQTAIEESEEDDVILIAGKGHEGYQEIAGERHPFDDVVEVKKALGLVDFQEASCD